MINSKSKEDFIITIEQRLYESSKLWADCDENYHDFKEFISSLNGLIQSLRNLTFIIQSYKSIIPNFEGWYVSKQDEMRRDAYLRWAHESRNIVVKSSNLKLKSKTVVELMNWESHPLQTIEIDPLSENTEIINTYWTGLSVKNLTKALNEPIIRIERYWIADNLPEKELLWLTAYCYRYFKNMTLDLYGKIRVDKSHILSGFEKNAKILNKNTLFEDKRTLILNLKDGKKFSRRSEKVSVKDKELEKLAKKRYGIQKQNYIRNEDKFLDSFELVTETAKHLLGIDGHHVPMVFLFDKDLNQEIYSLVINDRAELYYSFRKLGDDILTKRAVAAIIVSEMWLKDLNLKIVGECVNIAAIRKDFFEIRVIPFEKNDGKVLVKPFKKITNRDDISYLKPVYDAIDAVNFDRVS